MHHSIEECNKKHSNNYFLSNVSVAKERIQMIQPWSRQIRYQRCKLPHCLQCSTLHSWIGIAMSALLSRNPFSRYLATATNDELLQEKVTASPTTATWDLVPPSSSPISNQAIGISLQTEDSSGSNGSTISFIVFSSILLFGTILFLLISCRRCRQYSVQKCESEWYLENSLAATDSSNNGNRNEGSDSTEKNDHSFSYIEKNHGISMETTEPDDEDNEYEAVDIESIPSLLYQQDIMASFHGPFELDLLIRQSDYDSDNYDYIDSADDYDTSYICDVLQHDDFDDLWNQDNEFDDDDYVVSGPPIHTGPIDIDSGESVPRTVPTTTLSTEPIEHTSKLMLPSCGKKRHRRDCLSTPFTTLNGATTIRKKRHKTVKKLREDYFHEKYHDRVQRFKALQPILESSEHDSISVSSISYRSKPRTCIALPEDSSDVIIDTTTSLTIDSHSDKIIV
jgi:hypothetical protein